MGREIFPVYCFQDSRKVEVFHGFDTQAATNFALSERWPSQPNGFYLGVSRTIEPVRTWAFIRLQDDYGRCRVFTIRGDLPGANMGRHLNNFMHERNLRITDIYLYDARSLREARRWLQNLDLM